MRVIPITARMEMNASASEDVGIFLLTITHPILEGPIYISSDPTERLSAEPLYYGTVSRGIEYMFLPMSAQVPGDLDEQTPGSQIVLDNIVSEDEDGTRTSVSDLIRLSPTHATVKIEIVTSLNPNDVVVSAPDLLTVNASYDSGTVSLELSVDDHQAEPFPALSFTPTYFGTL